MKAHAQGSSRRRVREAGHACRSGGRLACRRAGHHARRKVRWDLGLLGQEFRGARRPPLRQAGRPPLRTRGLWVATRSATHGRRRSPAAFTLIEILLAVAIFGVVLVAVHSVFHVALRLRNRTVQALEAELPLQQTLSVLRRDLAGIIPPGGTFGGALDSNPSIQGTALSGTPLLQFHTAVGVLSEDNPWSDIERVAYSLASPTNGTAEGLDLVRAVTRNLLPVSQETVESQRLMSGVESLTFSFHDGTSWLPTWDSTNEITLLPRAIKVGIQRVPAEGTGTRSRSQLQPIEIVVGLLIDASTNTTGSGSTSTNSETQGAGNQNPGGGNPNPGNGGGGNNPPAGGGGQLPRSGL